MQKAPWAKKTGAGIYRKEGRTIKVLDLKTGDYRVADQQPAADVITILKLTDPVEKMMQLRACQLPEAQFLWSCYRDLFHYSAYHLEDIADTVRDVDLAIRWGFGWKQGPFEIWQRADWSAVNEALTAEMAAGKTLTNASMPSWVATQNDGVYQASGAYSPADNAFKPRSSLAAYDRQLFPEPMLAENVDQGQTLYETDAIRLWHLGDDVGILSFKTKANTIGKDVLMGIQESLAIAEQTCSAMVLWQNRGANFSVGADLSSAVGALSSGQTDAFTDMVASFQQTSQAIRYSQIPVVAAVKGYVFGGGCELMMHCDRIVAASESYIGLVEAGVGLLPAGGGCKEFALRAAEQAERFGGDVFNFIKQPFEQIAKAEVAISAADAKQRGFLREADHIVMNRDEILFVAKEQAKALAASSYRPPMARLIPVAGKTGLATLQMLLVNYRDGGFISEHDYRIALNVATIVCGGEVEAGSLVDEAWLLKLERDLFLELGLTQKTQQRIAHTLKTGKPLRN